MKVNTYIQTLYGKPEAKVKTWNSVSFKLFYMLVKKTC
jgi:hypothetical protein